MNKNPRWLDQFEILLLGAIASISGVVALLDFLGVLDEVTWLAERVPTLTLLAMGLVATYLVVERRGYLENFQSTSNSKIDNLEKQLEDSVQTIVKSLDGIEFRSFDTGNELLTYITKRMTQAKSRIDDLSWSPAISWKHGLDTTRKLNQKYVEQTVKASNKLLYREIFIFNRPGRIERLKQRLDENAPGYSCAYYESNNIPVIQFMIIDGEEIIFLTDQFPHYFAFRHPEIVALFSEYYEVIWVNAAPLKLGETIVQEEVDKILKS